MTNTNESEFERILLKNLFREILLAKEFYQDSLLDKMVATLADIFLREFGSGRSHNKILREHENIEEWLEEKIENFKP